MTSLHSFECTCGENPRPAMFELRVAEILGLDVRVLHAFMDNWWDAVMAATEDLYD